MTFTGFSLPVGAWLPPELVAMLPKLSGAELKIVIVSLNYAMVVGGGEGLTQSEIGRLAGLSKPTVINVLSSLTGDQPLNSGAKLDILTRRPVGRTYIYEPKVKKLYQAEPAQGKKTLPQESQGKETLPQTPIETLNNFTQPLIDQELIKFINSEIVQNELRRLEVYPGVVRSLLGSFELATIWRHISYYRAARREGIAPNVSYLVKSCREDWPPPSSWTVADLAQVEPEPEPPVYDLGEPEPVLRPVVEPKRAQAPIDGSSLTPSQLWSRVKSDLKTKMAQGAYLANLANVEQVSWDGETLTAYTTDAEQAAWLNNRAGMTARRAASGSLGRPINLTFQPQPAAA